MQNERSKLEKIPEEERIEYSGGGPLGWGILVSGINNLQYHMNRIIEHINKIEGKCQEEGSNR